MKTRRSSSAISEAPMQTIRSGVAFLRLAEPRVVKGARAITSEED